MKFSVVTILSLLVAPCSGAFFQNNKVKIQNQPTITSLNALSNSNDYETVLGFNAQFQQGLKYVLVPQLKNKVQSGSWYDDHPLPVTDNTPSTETLASVTATAPPAPEVVNAIDAVRDTLVQPTTMSVSEVIESLQETVSSSSSETVKSIMDSASTALASTASSGSYANDAIVAKTIEQLKDVAERAPDYLKLIPKGAPEGQGLATPLVEYVINTLREVRDHPKYVSPFLEKLSKYQPSPDFRTTADGFQVKTVILDEIERNQGYAMFLADKVAHTPVWFYDNAKISFDRTSIFVANNAEKITQMNDAVKSQIATNMQYPLVSLDKFAAVPGNMQHVLTTPGFKMSDVAEALNLKELGGWYAGAIVGILLIAAAIERQEAPKRAAAAVKIAMEKDIMKKQKEIEKENLERQRLEGMVAELTTAVAILTQELKDLKTGKAQTEYALASMRSDVRTVQNEFDRSSTAEYQLKQILEESKKKNELLTKELDAARFEVQTLKEVNDALTEGIASIDIDKSFRKARVLDPHPPESPPPESTTTTTHVEKKVVAEIKKPSEIPLSEVFFATIVDTNVKKAAPTLMKNGTKQPVNNGKVNGSTVNGAVNNGKSNGVSVSAEDDWSNLPVSALKRKPVTEIINYLKRKGASITDENGNLLKKSQLVEKLATATI